MVVTLISGNATAWDVRPFLEKLAYWKACADEFQPATEYCHKLLLGPLPSDQLVEAVEKDKTLTARRRWGIVRLIEDAKKVDKDLGESLFESLKETCLFDKKRMLEHLNAMERADIHWRRIEQAQQLVKKWDPNDSRNAIEGFCESRCCSPSLSRKDYEDSLVASLALIDDKWCRDESLFWNACLAVSVRQLQSGH